MNGTPHEDDFREISELLSGAPGRYRSARARVRFSVDAAVSRESNRRFVNWRFEQTGGTDMRIVGKPGPSVREDFYHDYEDAQDEVLLWHERPDRWREEIREGATGGLLLHAVAFGGRGAGLWTYEGRIGRAMHVTSVPEARQPDPHLAFMLDPSEQDFLLSLLDGATIEKTGRTAVVAGREAAEFRARTISWGYPPYVFFGGGCLYGAPDGTTDHLLLVDAEVGTILRAAARLEGRESYSAEVIEIAYDEEFPEGTFRLELPGVEFRRMER
jgi:hypothetical protein